jgi:chromosome segregation ATPase
MTQVRVDDLELKLKNKRHISDEYRVQIEALDHAIADAAREGEMLSKQLKEAEALRDSQIKSLEDLTRTLAHAQAELSERTEELRKLNVDKTDKEVHLRAEYERQKERSSDLTQRAHDLQETLDKLEAEAAARSIKVEEREAKLMQIEAAADMGESRLKELEEKLAEAESRWENVEKVEASGYEKDLETRLEAVKEARARAQELKEQVLLDACHLFFCKSCSLDGPVFRLRMLSARRPRCRTRLRRGCAPRSTRRNSLIARPRIWTNCALF